MVHGYAGRIGLDNTRRLPVRKLLLPIVALVAIVAGSVSWAQEVSGGLEGWVLDTEGRPLPTASVSVTGPGLQGARGVVTDDRGHFRFLSLPIGTYTGQITRISYRETGYRNVRVALGQTTSLGEIRLETRPVEMPPVIVTSELPIIDSTTASSSDSLHVEAFELLPIERNFRDMIALFPQANTSFLGDQTNVAGATGLENVYFIDGVNTTDPYRARISTNLPYNFVKEVQLKSGGYEAEFGRAMGGIVNVVTHSGGNEFRWDAFGFLTGDSLAAERKFGLLDAQVDGFSTYDVGFTFGGPVIPDRLWYFAAFNARAESQDIDIPGAGLYEDDRETKMFAGKLTWLATPNTDVTLTAFGDPSTHDRVGPADYDALGSPVSLENPDPFLGYAEEGGINVSLQTSSRVASNVLIETAVARNERDEIQHGRTETGRTEPLFNDNTTGVWSGGFGLNRDAHSVRTSLSVHGTIFRGRHTFKAGIEYEDNSVDIEERFSDPGWIQKFGDAFFGNLVANTDVKVRNRVPTVFIQDSWRVRNRMRLNLGLRWEGQYLIGSDGETAQSITDQFQPRLGFVYQPGTPGTQKVFGSIGRFYQQMPLFLSTLGHSQRENRFEFYNEDPRNPGAVPYHVDEYASPDWPIRPEIEGIEGEHFDEIALGCERVLGERLKVGIRGTYRTLREVYGFGFDPTVGPLGSFVDGNLGKGELDFLPEPRREYSALQLGVERAHEKLSFAAYYVLSRNEGNYTGLYASDQRFSTPGNNFSLQLEEQAVNSDGLLPNDRTHALKFFGSYRVRRDLTLGTFFTLQSGTPLNDFGATFLGFRPSFLVERGSAGRTPTVWDLNFRLAYDGVGLGKAGGRLILDVLHAGGQRKAVDFDQVRYPNFDELGNPVFNPNFGEETRYQPPMTVRLGIELGL